MKELEYPFDNEYILTKRRALKKRLLEKGTNKINKKIAVLGGSTTHDIIQILELFLLDYDIQPIFYESQYSQYWVDAMFENKELKNFAPDLIYIHTTNRNILEIEYPLISDSEEEINNKLNNKFNHFFLMWEKLRNDFKCPIIQNNMDYLPYRLLGNMDNADIHGKINFINQLNKKFSDYAYNHENFYIQDINWLSSCIGLYKWQNPFYWHMYKCSPSIPVIPELAFNLSNIIKAIYGKNRKAFVLDLDNTLWGGVIGEEGVENIEIGEETNIGQIYAEFQSYIKSLKNMGIMLNISSKNEEKNAYEGLNRPDSILKPEDFIIIKANWEPKDKNIKEIVQKLNIGEDALVFIDDNPAERHLVKERIPSIAVPDITNGQECCPEDYIRIIDRSAFFECIHLSNDDLKRNEMYIANAKRLECQTFFSDYTEYLESLDMNALIRTFSPKYMSRISQLTNKSNQFNLTSKRYSQAELEIISQNSDYIKLYGQLRDKFGDNGIVSVALGHIGKPDEVQMKLLEHYEKLDLFESLSKLFNIDLWLMSCRVIKRNMEAAMMDKMIQSCRDKGITTVLGYYYPTEKNSIVSNFYETMGFNNLCVSDSGASVWILLTKDYKNKNNIIRIN